jgi:nucleoside-diphosphate-sugar epimerase
MRACLLVFGLGYSGTAIAHAAAAAGVEVMVASRTPAPLAGLTVVGFAAAGERLGEVTHLLATAPPGEAGDPVLARHGAAIAAAPALRWIGYLSTTGVYGNRDGGWVDETTSPDARSDRAGRRVAAEAAWAGCHPAARVDLFRLAGIYGPGRSPFEAVRAGTARRVIKPGHMFGRIHRDDIAAAVVGAMLQPDAPSPRVLNLSDDEPAASADVLAEAARLLGLPPPPAVPFAEAWAGMSAMGRSFWADDRKVSSAATKAALGLTWRYPTYREGLAATLAEELGQPGPGVTPA